MKKLLVVFCVAFLLFACGELPDTFKVIYHSNGSTSGFAPVDKNKYKSGQFATVLGSGTLVNNGHTFGGWSIKLDNTGLLYNLGDQIEIKNINIFLFPVWN